MTIIHRRTFGKCWCGVSAHSIYRVYEGERPRSPGHTMRTLNFQDLTPMKSLPWALLPVPWVMWEALPSHRYRAFCQTLKQEFHLRGEVGYEKFQPRVIFPQGCHEHLKTGVYNGGAVATVTTLLQKCDTVLKCKHYNKKKHLNDAWKDNQDM